MVRVECLHNLQDLIDHQSIKENVPQELPPGQHHLMVELAQVLLLAHVNRIPQERIVEHQEVVLQGQRLDLATI